MKRPGHLLILFLCLVHHVSSQFQSHCNSLLSCDQCISSVFPCSWCSSRSYVEQFFPPCDTPASLQSRGCPDDDVITADSPLSISGESIGVSPTQVTGSLRPTFRKSFEIKVTPPQNYPVDIYMLFDNTRSMDPYLPIAKAMSVELLRFIRNVSFTSKIGFGTFVDKETIPFHFDQDKGSKGHFPGVSHAFQNVLPLSSNEGLVATSVSNISTGTNDDQPEGVLEAIVQSLACTKEIKWRKAFTAYRMIVLMSDSDIHYALDGRLAGIVTPNNLKCSLENGRYVNSGAQDYPSLLQFLTLVLEENVLPIMITDGDFRDLYEEMLGIIGIRNTTIILNTDLDIIVNLVQKIYLLESTSSRPLLLPENDIIQFNLTMLDCGGGIFQPESKSCVEIPRNSSATYKLEVWLNPDQACTSGHDHPHSLQLRFQGFGIVNVSINSVCECQCSSTSEINSSLCSSNGDLTCGDCECNEGFSGPKCECGANTTQTCVQPGATAVCSNKGICNCGVCKCNGESFGEFCHCDNSRCPVYNGEVCGGPARGRCDCDGTCICTPEYEDSPQGQCSCLKPGLPESQDRCTDPEMPYNGLCNRFGSCTCGECKCDDGGDFENPDHEGQYCEICNVCGNSCENLRPCLACLFSTGSISCCREKPGESAVFSYTNETELDLLQLDPNYRMCNLFDQSGCIWDYVIAYNLTGREQGITLFVRRRACTSPTWWIWLVIAFLIVTVTGVAVIILIRFLVWMMERKEFKDFSDQHKKAVLPFQESPLYVPPVTEVENPTYKKMKSMQQE